MEDKFLTQVIDSPTVGEVSPDLLVTNTRGLKGDVKIGGSLGGSDQALVEFTVLRNMGQERSQERPLNFRKVDFQLFRDIVNEIPWESALRGQGEEESRQISLRKQEPAIPRSKKSDTEGGRLAWLSRELLVKLKGKKQMQKQWK